MVYRPQPLNSYDEAQKRSFKVPWKATECFSGPECWCRIIVPVEPIHYGHPETDTKYEYSIVDAGSIDQETAEYIVNLHNDSLKRDKIVSEGMLEAINKSLSEDAGESQ